MVGGVFQQNRRPAIETLIVICHVLHTFRNVCHANWPDCVAQHSRYDILLWFGESHPKLGYDIQTPSRF